ncbi:hypothetical protein [Paraburkholderia oxyphila]|uniref:hypothetical protein n=1 Tax=Paraburkholderia oxyphila TaxID=614212 RepID=UPI0004803A5F|nr:hypothetical protein [Paraburkholderia oxyphila]
MDRLENAWTTFMHWHWLVRRAAIALACYVLAMIAVWLYAEGLQAVGKLFFTAGSIGFSWAVGFLYTVRTVISLVFRCRRMFM